MSSAWQWAFVDGLTPRAAVVGFFFNVLCSLYALVALIWFIRRRNFFPVSERFHFMIVCGIAAFTQLFWSNLAFPEIPCAVPTIVFVLSTQTIILCYVCRLFDLLFKSNIAASLTYDLGPMEDSPQQPHTNWFLMNRRFASRSFQARCLACYGLIVVVGIVVAFLGDPALSSPKWCETLPPLQRVNIIFLLAWFLVLAGLAFALRGATNDALSFKQELKYTFVAAIVCFVPFVVVGVTLSLEYNALGRFPMFMLLFTAGFLYPVHLSYRHEKFLKADARGVVLTQEMNTQLLAKILVSCDFMVFLNFLKTEFSAENGMFLRAYIDLRASDHQSVEDFTRIAAQYILPNSIGEVNIPYDLRLPIMKLLGVNTSKYSRRSSSCNHPKPGAEVLLHKFQMAFDAARDEVFRCVVRDSLPRFLATAQGAKVRGNLMPSLSPRRDTRMSLSAGAGKALRNLIRHASDSHEDVPLSNSAVSTPTNKHTALPPSHQPTSSSSSIHFIAASVEQHSAPPADVINGYHHSVPSFDSSTQMLPDGPHVMHSIASTDSGPELSSRNSLNSGRVSPPPFMPVERMASEEILIVDMPPSDIL